MRHGTWMVKDSYTKGWEFVKFERPYFKGDKGPCHCSECGGNALFDDSRREVLTDYCPRCGTPMDGNDQELKTRVYNNNECAVIWPVGPKKGFLVVIRRFDGLRDRLSISNERCSEYDGDFIKKIVEEPGYYSEYKADYERAIETAKSHLIYAGGDHDA